MRRAGHRAGLRGVAPRGSEGLPAAARARSRQRPPPSWLSEARGAPDARWESGPERAPGSVAASPEVAGAGAPRLAGAARRAAARGGLSSGNWLRETEGKTSRGRSAVIGLETDLKGKVGAAAVTAAQPAHPGARSASLARRAGGRLCFRATMGPKAWRCRRAAAALTLTRAPARPDEYIH